MKTTDMNYTPIQLKLPVDMDRIIKINDPVYSFSEVMAHIDLNKYFVEKEHETGRPRYDREKLLKIVLFAFMEYGYCSLSKHSVDILQYLSNQLFAAGFHGYDSGSKGLFYILGDPLLLPRDDILAL